MKTRAALLLALVLAWAGGLRAAGASGEGLTAYYFAEDVPADGRLTGLHSILTTRGALRTNVEVGSVPYLAGLRELLVAAGFRAEPLPLDRAPAELPGDLIVFGSFANRAAEHQAYLQVHAKSLRAFVERGGVLLELAQYERNLVPFLPEGLRAARGDAQLEDIRVVQADHPLLAGLAGPAGRVALPRHLGVAPGWHTFMEQSGCAVLLGAGGDIARDNPVLLEAPGGNGRFLLASLFFDRLRTPSGELAAPRAYVDFAEGFMRNLSGYVRAVKDGRARAVEVTPPPEPWPFVEGSWALAVLPDTQYYARRHHEVFDAQTRWVAAQAAALNIKYVLHLGDITADNLEPQWEVAQRAMSRLDGVVPYAIVGGNHDYGPKGNSATRESFFNDYFPASKYASWPTLGGLMEPGRIDNSFHLFEAGGDKWIIVALEWAPRDEAVEWADRVLREHPGHRGILLTHAYLNSDDTRYDFAQYGEGQEATPHHYQVTKLPGRGNDGGELWRKLVSRHPGMVLTVNGHTPGDGVARIATPGAAGNVVHQMLVNYQRVRPTGGNGFLRLYEFLPDGETVQVRSYSPSLGLYRTDIQNQFRFRLPRRGG